MAMVATGTAAAQAITMAFYPFITRIYGPESFGVLGVFMSIVSILTPIAALSYPLAIVLPKKNSHARGLIRLSIYIAALLAILVTFIITVFKYQIVRLLGIESITGFLYLIPFVMFFSVILAVLKQWLLRTKKYKITAKVAVAQSFIISSAKVGIGWFSPTAAVLIIITGLGTILESIMLFVGVKRDRKKEPSNNENNPISLIGLAKKHKDFPFFRSPQAFINAASQGLPVLMLTAFFGPVYAGFYALGRTVMLVPTHLIGKSVGDVFYPRIAEAANTGEDLTKLIKKATLALAATSFIPFFIIIAFGPFLFGFIFGSEWITAGEYARWLALWLYFSLLNRPSVASIPVLALQESYLIYEIISVIARVGALGLGFYHFKSDVYAIILFSLVGLFLNVGLILWVCYKSQHANNDKNK
ncbi:MAG: oligosaccharide flippase family protein [Fulvivirga sp.]